MLSVRWVARVLLPVNPIDRLIVLDVVGRQGCGRAVVGDGLGWHNALGVEGGRGII